MMAQSAVAMGFWKSAAIVALAAVAALTTLTADAATRRTRPAPPPKEAAVARAAGEPIMAIVSIKSQQVIFYDAEGWILRAPVSTGTKGRETPAGVFAVIEKEMDHHSSMYDDAWMPHMQRITWNGIALHGGPLPGYAASHGCVRMPFGFAEGLYDKTRIGMRVIISPNDAVPVEFSHPALFVPNAEAIAAAPARAMPLAREAAEAAMAADDAKRAAAEAAREAASLAALLRKLESLKKSAEAQLALADKAIAAADQAKARAEERQQKAAAKVGELAAQIETTAAANDATQTNDEAKNTLRIAALRKLEAIKARAGAELALAEKTITSADQAKARAEERRQKAAAKAAELATQIDTARSDSEAKVADAAAAKDAVKAAQIRKAETAKAVLDARLAFEPVSVYISRATQKLYVRRNTHKPAPDGGGEVFDTSIEVPVTIRDPDMPIGTHVFTAMARNDAGLRWTAVTINDGDDAKDALDRITIPQEVLDRIAPTALPRSSIIISDEPLSQETNYRTEFVAVLSNHPQGGFITRKPTVVPVARDSFFSFFEYRDSPRRRCSNCSEGSLFH
ncbi:MAG: hypothetical protein A2514_00375 [Gammaproteobacteria bacterium RIFOXYD12_FULL_61_37]|nr:MAG: hypothetical protein A2514_00375 [Gammaproteobacteria bacterium RIFOXYD12_FULL_61_37]